MGQDKLSLPVGNGLSMLEATAQALSRAPFERRLLVVRDSSHIAFDPDHYGFLLVEIGDEAGRGMHRSLKLGLEALGAGAESAFEAVMICLGDQPFLRTDDYSLVLSTYREGLEQGLDLLSPVRSGRRGNPAVIHRRYLAEILAEPDRDQGCRYLFERYPSRVNAWEAPSPAFFQDLDTPEDYKACLN